MLSAATLKGRRVKLRQDVPRPGTRVRAVYDLFKAARGQPLTGSLMALSGTGRGAAYALIETLRNCYGLDIRRLHNRRWVLAGEWDGRVYIDHIAARLQQTRHG